MWISQPFTPCRNQTRQLEILHGGLNGNIIYIYRNIYLYKIILTCGILPCYTSVLRPIWTCVPSIQKHNPNRGRRACRVPEPWRQKIAVLLVFYRHGRSLETKGRAMSLGPWPKCFFFLNAVEKKMENVCFDIAMTIDSESLKTPSLRNVFWKSVYTKLFKPGIVYQWN